MNFFDENEYALYEPFAEGDKRPRDRIESEVKMLDAQIAKALEAGEGDETVGELQKRLRFLKKGKKPEGVNVPEDIKAAVEAKKKPAAEEKPAVEEKTAVEEKPPVEGKPPVEEKPVSGGSMCEGADIAEGDYDDLKDACSDLGFDKDSLCAHYTKYGSNVGKAMEMCKKQKAEKAEKKKRENCDDSSPGLNLKTVIKEVFKGKSGVDEMTVTAMQFLTKPIPEYKMISQMIKNSKKEMAVAGVFQYLKADPKKSALLKITEGRTYDDLKTIEKATKGQLNAEQSVNNAIAQGMVQEVIKNRNEQIKELTTGLCKSEGKRVAGMLRKSKLPVEEASCAKDNGFGTEIVGKCYRACSQSLGGKGFSRKECRNTTLDGLVPEETPPEMIPKCSFILDKMNIISDSDSEFYYDLSQLQKEMALKDKGCDAKTNRLRNTILTLCSGQLSKGVTDAYTSLPNWKLLRSGCQKVIDLVKYSFTQAAVRGIASKMEIEPEQVPAEKVPKFNSDNITLFSQGQPQQKEMLMGALKIQQLLESCDANSEEGRPSGCCTLNNGLKFQSGKCNKLSTVVYEEGQCSGKYKFDKTNKTCSISKPTTEYVCTGTEGTLNEENQCVIYNVMKYQYYKPDSCAGKFNKTTGVCTEDGTTQFTKHSECKSGEMNPETGLCNQLGVTNTVYQLSPSKKIEAFSDEPEPEPELVNLNNKCEPGWTLVKGDEGEYCNKEGNEKRYVKPVDCPDKFYNSSTGVCTKPGTIQYYCEGDAELQGNKCIVRSDVSINYLYDNCTTTDEVDEVTQQKICESNSNFTCQQRDGMCIKTFRFVKPEGETRMGNVTYHGCDDGKVIDDGTGQYTCQKRGDIAYSFTRAK